MHKKFFAVAALALSVIVPLDAAHASSWKLVGESQDDTTKAWVDTNSIRKTKDYTGAWYRMNLSDGSWFVTFSVFNCDARSFMDLKMTAYDRRGSATNMDSTLKAHWDLPRPDSMMQGVVDEICGGGW